MEPAGGPMGVLEKSSKVKSLDTNCANSSRDVRPYAAS